MEAFLGSLPRDEIELSTFTWRNPSCPTRGPHTSSLLDARKWTWAAHMRGHSFNLLARWTTLKCCLAFTLSESGIWSCKCHFICSFFSLLIFTKMSSCEFINIAEVYMSFSQKVPLKYWLINAELYTKPC